MVFVELITCDLDVTTDRGKLDQVCSPLGQFVVSVEGFKLEDVKQHPGVAKQIEPEKHDLLSTPDR